MTDYVDDYYHFIKENNIPIGNKIQQAFERHYNDIEKSKDEAFPFVYKPDEAIKPVQFIGSMPDPKSLKANELAPFQKFILGMLYGWRTKDGNHRRFRKAYISVARKNGKSLLVSGICLYDLLFARNPAASRQIYSSANKLDQAKIVFNMVKTQLNAIRNQSKAIKNFTKVNRYEILCNDESVMKPLATDSSTLDGLDVLTAVIDEYAEAKDTTMIDVLQSSQAQQADGLVVMISTASSNLNGPMYQEEYAFISKLLKNEVKNDQYLALCWELDSLSEADDERNWVKANPLLSNKDVAKNMLIHKRSTLEEARGKVNLSNWLTKEMNMFVQSSKQSFIDKESWDAIKATKEYDIKGRKVYIGLDMARTSDMTAVSWVIPIEEEKKLLMDTHCFVSTIGGITYKTQQDKIPYKQYEEMGLIHFSTHPDGIIEVEQMTQWIQDFIAMNDLQLISIYYDPALANRAVAELSKVYPKKLVEIPQRINYLSAPTKNLRDLILRKEIMHNNNPLLTRAAYNAELREYNDAYAIDKSINRNKIDAMDAIINCMVDAQYHDFEAPSLQDLIDSDAFGFGF